MSTFDVGSGDSGLSGNIATGAGVVSRPSSPLTMLLSRHTRRREFIALLGSGAATLPFAAHAQQRNEKQRVAVLMGGLTFGDADGQAETAALEDGLKELGWKPGDNINLDYRWPGAELSQVTVAANEIVGLEVARESDTDSVLAMLNLLENLSSFCQDASNSSYRS